MIGLLKLSEFPEASHLMSNIMSNVIVPMNADGDCGYNLLRQKKG